MLIRRSSTITNVACSSALTALSPTFGIRALEVLQPAADRHRASNNILFFVFLEEQRRKKTNKKLASHCVKSQMRVSRPVVLCPCDCNRLKGTPCATTDTIVLHSVKRHLNRSPNVVHPLVVTTRCRSVFRQHLVSVSCFIRLIDIREDQLDPSISSLQPSETKLAQIIGFM